MQKVVPPQTAETVRSVGATLAGTKELGAELPIIITLNERVGWATRWLLWSRAIASIGISLLGHAGVLAWLGYASVTFLPRRVPVQQGRASIDLQACFESASAAPPPEVAMDVSAMDELPPTWDVQASRPFSLAAVNPTPVSLQRVDVTAPLQVDDSLEVDIPSPTPVRPQPLVHEEMSPAGPQQKRVTEPRLTRTSVKVEPTISVRAESLDDLASAPSTASPASRASQGADSVPAVVFNPAPRYPAEALRARIEGRVVIYVTISPTGSVSAARVHESSGSETLDQAALEAVRVWRFSPADGYFAAERHAAVPIRFAIDR